MTTLEFGANHALFGSGNSNYDVVILHAKDFAVKSEGHPGSRKAKREYLNELTARRTRGR